MTRTDISAVCAAEVLAGRPADLRLWIVDHANAAWVTMPRSKADAHGLSEVEVDLLAYRAPDRDSPRVSFNLRETDEFSEDQSDTSCPISSNGSQRSRACATWRSPPTATCSHNRLARYETLASHGLP